MWSQVVGTYRQWGLDRMEEVFRLPVIICQFTVSRKKPVQISDMIFHFKFSTKTSSYSSYEKC